VAGEAPPPCSLGGETVRVLVISKTLRALGHRCFLVLLRFGGGVKLKTMTAFARGIFTISSAVGCTGLSVRDGEHLLIRDTAAGFAAAVGTLAADPFFRVKLGEAGRRLIAEEHISFRIAKALSVEYEAILGRIFYDQRSH
jgi:glycosyltransferase involved in cell wall biosynthesis